MKLTKNKRHRSAGRGQYFGVRFFITFSSALLVIAWREQITEEMTREQEDDAGCAA